MSNSTNPVSGTVLAKFDAVASAFADSFADGSELGACFSVCIDGETVIDLFGGYADKQQTTAWTEETITCIYSSGKAVTALLIARAVSDGVLDYERPLCADWQEFGAQGKGRVTLGEALSHQAGLAGFVDEVSPAIWIDWDASCDALAAMKPLWEPGTRSGYHAQTFGYLAGEPLRRRTDKTVGAHLREYGFDVYCGMSEDEQARTAIMTKPPMAPDLGELNAYTQAAFLKSWSSAAGVSRADWMAAEIPASNMHANARALAQFLHPLANQGRDISGVQTIDEAVLPAFYRERCQGADLVLPFTLSWAAGMMRNVNGHFGPGKRAVGHAGFGGSAVVIDPDQRMTIGYVMNKMSPHLVADPRSLALIDAVYDCL